jgi:signal transduction histidine kinase
LTEFIDNGHGLPDDGADKIFDAFVSTEGNRMGIGLAISHSIAEAYNGDLWAQIIRSSELLSACCSKGQTRASGRLMAPPLLSNSQ